MFKRRWMCSPQAVLVLAVSGYCGGCQKPALTEVRGKTSFGPEFRHGGTTNRAEIRYDARQAVELRWDNGWTSGLTYRRRDIDNGSGDNENLFLFEVGYPIWKAPKKEEKKAEGLQKRVDDLEKELAGLREKFSSGISPTLAPQVSAVGSAGNSQVADVGR